MALRCWPDVLLPQHCSLRNHMVNDTDPILESPVDIPGFTDPPNREPFRPSRPRFLRNHMHNNRRIRRRQSRHMAYKYGPGPILDQRYPGCVIVDHNLHDPMV